MEVYRRRLPHISAPGRAVFLTWRLYGSLPTHRSFPTESLTSGQVFVAWDRLLDRAAFGPVHLNQPIAADIVRATIRSHAEDLKHYDLQAWVVMPNHVHMLVTPLVPLAELTKRLKGVTARLVNQALNLTGALWQDESFDRVVRNDEEFARTLRYIENNPVAAGSVSEPSEYRWSSAWAD